MIKDLKDLEKLLKLCRKQGVTEIKLEGCELRLGDMPQVLSSGEQVSVEKDAADPWADFPGGMLTPEQLAYYSAGGHPDDDPYREKQ